MEINTSLKSSLILLDSNPLPKETLNKQETKNFLESLRLWLKNLYIFDAIFDWDHEKNIEPIISLKYDIPKWYKNNQVGISNFKKEVNYKMVYNKRNENLKNEIITLHGRQDKTYAVGKYFHQMYVNNDDILKSSIEVK